MNKFRVLPYSSLSDYLSLIKVTFRIVGLVRFGRLRNVFGCDVPRDGKLSEISLKSI